ncbi:nuclease-related domain-containing protein [Sporosarcina thermotolerans]|uniref:nuclease-related domain-containing protein n=1 Tax=Sporosarcina thermotolerans TaxID=633404 RepID=UPI0024BD4B45|nr:nuclease-related domain-containing protein [Sporosarcina thermotolerans]WHT48332.1 nuclease-related domain-containing protein [Sporosarcina thermotolerans]
MHDVTLCEDNIYFQMDSILITPAFIVISEVKNIAEKIIIKSKPLQFIKEYSTGKRVPLQNPIVELERKIYLLDSWLKRQKVEIPIKGIVAFAYNNELSIEENPSMDIMFTNEVAAHLRSLQVNKELLYKSEIHSLARKIVKYHQEYNPFPLIKRYNIHPAHIIPGVICSKCDQLKMNWLQKKWRCPHCGHTGKNDHEGALKDWSMLVKNNITNREFRYFTQLENRNTAKKLLARSPIELSGNGRASKYEIVLDPFIHTEVK